MSLWANTMGATYMNMSPDEIYDDVYDAYASDDMYCRSYLVDAVEELADGYKAQSSYIEWLETFVLDRCGEDAKSMLEGKRVHFGIE